MLFKILFHSIDVLLNDEEKEQGYALASDELEREKDRLADKEDLLLRVETIHNVSCSPSSVSSATMFSLAGGGTCGWSDGSVLDNIRSKSTTFRV